TPAVLAPTALALLAAVSDDRVPVAVRLFLSVRRDLKRERLAVLERGPTVETDAGNPHHHEFHRDHIAGFAARKITRRFVRCRHLAVGKSGGVKTRGFFRVLVVPETDRVFGLHSSSLP